MISRKENAVALASLDEGVTIMRSATAVSRMRVSCWVGCLIIAGIAWAYSWWILLGLVAIFSVDRWLAASEKRYWMFLAALLLSLDMLADNFAGWGAAYPGIRKQALEILGCSSAAPRNTVLEYYLPERARIADELLTQFGPSSPAER
jgi:hypothetical protein